MISNEFMDLFRNRNSLVYSWICNKRIAREEEK